LQQLHKCLLHAAAAAAQASPAAPAAAAAASEVCSTAEAADFEAFCSYAASGANIVPLFQRIFSDQLTPVLAYRALVQQNDIQSPSFLLESVVNGDQQGRYSFVGASPALEVVAKGHKVTLLDHQAGSRQVSEEEDPMEVPVQLSRNWKPAKVEGLPEVFTGGWVGYAGYDTVRYVYGSEFLVLVTCKA
jgi:anthranilate synthase component 1